MYNQSCGYLGSIFIDMYLCDYQGFLNFMTLRYTHNVFQVPGNFHVSTHGAGNQVIFKFPSAMKITLFKKSFKARLGGVQFFGKDTCSLFHFAAF